MNIYLLLRKDGEGGWDEFEGFVVAAESEEDARDMAQAKAVARRSNETSADIQNNKLCFKSFWDSAELTTVEILSGDTWKNLTPAILLSSFHAG